jgi:hypothetical protein
MVVGGDGITRQTAEWCCDPEGSAWWCVPGVCLVVRAFLMLDSIGRGLCYVVLSGFRLGCGYVSQSRTCCAAVSQARYRRLISEPG